MEIDIDTLIDSLPAVEAVYENLYKAEVQILCSLQDDVELSVKAMCRWALLYVLSTRDVSPSLFFFIYIY